jgi:hypothetical protein
MISWKRPHWLHRCSFHRWEDHVLPLLRHAPRLGFQLPPGARGTRRRPAHLDPGRDRLSPQMTSRRRPRLTDSTLIGCSPRARPVARPRGRRPSRRGSARCPGGAQRCGCRSARRSPGARARTGGSPAARAGLVAERKQHFRRVPAPWAETSKTLRAAMSGPREKPCRGGAALVTPSASAAAALHGGLELAAGGELRDRGRGDLHLL